VPVIARDNASSIPPPSWLVCRVRDRMYAVSADLVASTLPPLPVVRHPGETRPILGVATILGRPTMVVDLAWVAAGDRSRGLRFLALRTEQPLALAVDVVIGRRAIPASALKACPPVLRGADPGRLRAVTSLGVPAHAVFGNVRRLCDQTVLESLLMTAAAGVPPPSNGPHGLWASRPPMS
jgi:chemotaxis signal transduction protein